MGNGHPISAVVTTHEIAMKFVKARGEGCMDEVCGGTLPPSTLGLCPLPPPPSLQYTSDPVSLAIAEAVLTAIEDEGLQARAKQLGDYVMDGLRGLMEKHPCIGDVRGHGLFIGFELVKSRDTKEPDGQLAVELIQRWVPCAGEGCFLHH